MIHSEKKYTTWVDKHKFERRVKQIMCNAEMRQKI